MKDAIEEPRYAGESGEDPAHDERWKLVLRLSTSKEFSRAARLRDFLKYVCWHSLNGHTEELHEQQIGRAVFGRRPDYNPSEDNIVRVEARELRKRLDRYFAKKGSAEPLRISIPKGSYTATFEPNVQVTEGKRVSGAAGGNAQLPAGSSGPIGKLFGTGSPYLRRWGVAGIVVLILLGFLAIYRAGPGRDLDKSSVRNAAVQDSPVAAIWGLLFPPGCALNIVSADSSLVLVQDILHKDVTLSDYLSGAYGHDPGYPVLQRIAPNPYIDFSDLRTTSKILDAIRPLGIETQVQYPHYLNLTDLDTQNLIFLGSPYSDPWIKKLHPQMNFMVRMDRATGNLCFVNKKPEAGEPDSYCATGGPGQEDVTYGLVTFLPNLQHTGHILILAGTTGAGTDAAGDFMTDSHYVTSLRSFLNLKPKADPLPFFQILLKTVVLKNNPGKLQVIARRIISGNGGA